MNRTSSEAPTGASDQSNVIAFLSDPASYAGLEGCNGATDVARQDTHGAIVFLVGARAFKLKRAVNLGYLDFSTRGLREAACRHELERNAAFAPDLYIGVLPVVRSTNQALCLGGDGDVVDCVVVMHRFQQSQLLDSLAKRNVLRLDHIRDVARVIGEAHAKAKPVREDAAALKFIETVADVDRTLQRHPDIIGPTERAAHNQNMERALRRFRGAMMQRAERGCVRLCHGDLHLQNIVLLDQGPVLFDCIEFDDAIATIDVLYDLAFLIMDLWHRDLKQHANVCLSAYAACAMDAEDFDGLALLPLFIAMRASIRAMVGIDKMAQQNNNSQRNESRAAIAGYFELARGAMKPARPCLIAIAGLSGSGKSTIASGLAPSVGGIPGALHLRSDVERKVMSGVHPLDRLPREAYGPEQTRMVYRRLHQRADAALKAGQAVVVDATYLDARQRRTIEDLARSNGVPFFGVWLEAPADVLRDRVAARVSDASDADGAVVAKQLTQTDAPRDWHHVCADAAVEVVLTRVQRLIRTNRGRDNDSA